MAWIDKYKPSCINDLIINPNIKDKFHKMVENVCITNLIIAGDNGIGKSATMQCLVNEVYGNIGTNMMEYILMINPTFDKNVKYLQEKLEIFCKKKRINDKYKKVIMIDEIDNISQKSQRVINMIMEKYYYISSFVFVCNSTSNIIESIQSKCSIIRYIKPEKDVVVQLLIKICDQEKIKYTVNALEQLYIISQGDIRLTISNMQTINDVFGKITLENIFKMCDKPNPIIIKNIFGLCINKDIQNAITLTMNLKEKGYTGSDILSCMLDILKTTDIKILESDKIKLLNIIGLGMYNMSKGIDSNVQLTSCIIKMCL